MRVVLMGVALMFAMATGGARAQVAPPDEERVEARGGQTIPAPTDEKALLDRLHQANRTEIELGQLAAEKQVGDDVRRFGQMMVRDHSRLDEQLQRHARSHQVQIGEPRPANEAERSVMQATEATQRKLEALDGRQFEQAYLAEMVGEHDRVIGLVTDARQQFRDDAELMKLLDETLPILKQHRDRAYRLLGSPDVRAS